MYRSPKYIRTNVVNFDCFVVKVVARATYRYMYLRRDPRFFHEE